MRVLARRRLMPLWIGLLLLGAVGVPAFVAAGPVLHERFEVDPAEDLRLGATTPSGSMPAVLQTRSGLIAAPEEEHRPSTSPSPAYGGAKTSTSADAAYHVDRLTTRPDRVQYDEPFRPSVLPFKRVYAFDQLKKDFSFSVSDRSLSRVSVGGIAEDSEDTFFADFEVDLVAEVPVRIPSVGPGARIRALHVDPPQSIEIVEDGAENWFARAPRGGRARLVMQVSIPRKTFGSQFLPVSWSDLAPFVSTVPSEAQVVAARVKKHIGIDRSEPPARAMINLVQYFRKFKESSELPTASSSSGLYEELSVSQKGVCRHRAYAFAITALSLGLPTRLVHNEAHAWVEVFDTQMWHRIDLGGAASNIQETRPDPLLPNHRPPSDPYSWPRNSTPGLESGRSPSPSATQNQSRSEDSEKEGAATEAGSDDAAADARARGQDAARGNPSGGSPLGGGFEVLPEVTLQVREKRLRRGLPLTVEGSAGREGRPCVLARVDVFLGVPGKRVSVGSVATDQNGEFKGQVTVPLGTEVGAAVVTAQVAGGCD